jgi:hypothetical protein
MPPRTSQGQAKDKPKDKAMTYAASAATIPNPSFAAFLLELSDNEE